MARLSSVTGVDDVTTLVAGRFATLRGAGGTLDCVLRAHMSAGERLEGAAGYAKIRASMDDLESEIERTLARAQAVRIFLAARCLSPRLWTHLGAAGDRLQPRIRSTVESAILKYGRWAGPQPKLLGLPSFRSEELHVVAQAFVLGEAYANLHASLRRISKGEPQLVSASGPANVDPEQSQAGPLIDRLERRYANDYDPMTRYGTISDPNANLDDPPLLLGARFVLPSELIDEQGNWTSGTWHGNRPIRLADRVALWGCIDGRAALSPSIRAYDTSVRKAAGFGLIDLFAVQHLISLAVLESHSPETLPEPLELLGLTELPDTTPEYFRAVSGTYPYDQLVDGESPTPVTLERAFLHLLVDPPSIDLTSTAHPKPLLHLGAHRFVYDLCNASSYSPLALEHQLDEQARQRLTKGFERLTHSLLAVCGTQPWPAGRTIRQVGTGQTLTDVDASVQAGNVLIVVDCFSSPWSRALDQGDHSKVRSRAENLQNKVSKWQRQWNDIAARQPETLPTGVTSILPVVATSAPEWIPSDDPTFWLTDTIPAALTAAELVNGLRSWDLQSIRHLIRVNRT